MAPICCCPENVTKQIENCRMFAFKDSTLKEATLATIIDHFQHDYSSKMALFIESKTHLCKSCGGDSDSLIFLTPVQSMKLGMSILDTFHERRLNQLNQRLQNMIINRFSMPFINVTNDDDNNDGYHLPLKQTGNNSLFNNGNRYKENLMQKFYQKLYQHDYYEKTKYFLQLHNNVKKIDSFTKTVKSSSLFSPMGI